METKANYLLIGVFTILGFLGLLGFVAWFSKIELDRQYAYYDVYFDNVSGLDRASTVKFAGLAVGQVIDLELASNQDGTVRAILEVAADTPVRASSVAKIEAQGVTGVSFVGITAGEPADPILRGTRANMPTILAGTSTLQALSETAPKIADTALEAIERVNSLLSPENEAKVTVILDNLASSSAQLDQTLRDFSTVSERVSSSVEDIAGFTSGLEEMTSSVESTLQAADSALTTIDNFATNAQVTLEAGNKMLASADTTITLAGEFIDHEISALVQDLTVTSAQFRVSAQDLSDQAETTLREVTQTFVDARATLEALNTTLATADRSLVAAEGAFTGAQRIVNQDISPITEGLRGTIARLNAALDQVSADIPAVTGSLKSASARADAAARRVGTLIDEVDGQVTEFANEGLPQYTRLAREARALVDILESIAAQIERDPARFLLGGNTPRYRR